MVSVSHRSHGCLLHVHVVPVVPDVLGAQGAGNAGSFRYGVYLSPDTTITAADTLIFYPLAFYGSWDGSLLLTVMGGNYVMKVMWEVFATPVTYRVVAFLKRAESEDYYDRDTDFTPFSLKT